MKIKATLDRIPGGMMVVPLLTAAVINTVAPDLLRIGGFTQALFVDSAGVLIALFLLCTGAQINLKNVGVSLGKGATLLATKWVVGALFGLIAYMFAAEYIGDKNAENSVIRTPHSDGILPLVTGSQMSEVVLLYGMSGSRACLS